MASLCGEVRLFEKKRRRKTTRIYHQMVRRIKVNISWNLRISKMIYVKYSEVKHKADTNRYFFKGINSRRVFTKGVLFDLCLWFNGGHMRGGTRRHGRRRWTSREWQYARKSGDIRVTGRRSPAGLRRALPLQRRPETGHPGNAGLPAVCHY